MTQKERILKYLNDFGSITSRDAVIDLGIVDMRKRISELRREGYAIADRWERGQNRYGDKTEYKRYVLENGDNFHFKESL